MTFVEARMPKHARTGAALTLVALLVALTSFGAGCSPRSAPTARAPLTERQRDSVLARSGLPGAPVVGRALDVSDRAADRAAEMAASDSMFR
jgi:hypothetical protein